MAPEVITKTVEVKGIELPWQEVEPYGPFLMANGTWTNSPPKGTVLREGTVFIPMTTLHELAEQDQWDSEFGSPFLLGYAEGRALAAAGLAAQETRGGYHRTEALLAFLKEYQS